MLRLSRLRLPLVTSGSITHAATRLNALLDISDGKPAATRDDIKTFLKESVMPIMAGTELDRRGNSTELRQYLSMLTRDAAFAATIVHARPEAGFVQSIVRCIKGDQQHMRFISKMTSAQASKTIEHLCKIGVTDEEVYPVLISRLHYTNLQELARVMLALSEAGLDEVNMLVVVPLYCGDKWEVTATRNRTKPRARRDNGNDDDDGGRDDGGLARSNNVFEAVRVLRALSKSCRACVEERRAAPSHSLAPIPRHSLDNLRNNLLAFLFENAGVLRGAHWVNIARALLYFPSEVSELRQLDTLCPTIAEEVRAVYAEEKVQQGSSSPASSSGGASAALTCEAVAVVAIRHVFDYAEHRRDIPADFHGSLRPDFPFDMGYADLVKFLPMVEQNAITQGAHSAVREQRLALVLQHVCAHTQQLLLRDVVKTLQTLRRLPPSDTASAAVEVLVARAGECLTELPPGELLRRVPFKVIAQLAAALSALRVKECERFITFVSQSAPYFPHRLNIETTLSFANALANLANGRTAACHDALRVLLTHMFNTYETELQSAPLLSAHPHSVTKILRACVLLDYIPEREVLEKLLGSDKRPVVVTPEVRAAGGALVFGLSRSVSHFLKQARSACPERAEELWSVVVLPTLLPLTAMCSDEAAAQMQRARRADATTYTAVAWRATMEMLTAFLDPSLSHNTTTELAQRLVDVYPLSTDLLTKAAAVTRVQMDVLGHDVASAEVLRQRLRDVPFNNNCSVHFLSSLLIFEYLVFQSASALASSKGDSVPLELKVRVAHLKDTSYASFLRTPANTGVVKDAPMDVVQRIFDFPLSEGGAASSQTVLLGKRDALEITTNLPFALSLIMNPGPVNEYFTEHCMELMVSEDDS